MQYVGSPLLFLISAASFAQRLTKDCPDAECYEAEIVCPLGIRLSTLFLR